MSITFPFNDPWFDGEPDPGLEIGDLPPDITDALTPRDLPTDPDQ